MSGARVAIDGTDAIRMRAASALLADHRVDQIGILGRTLPKGWGRRAIAITDPTGWDVGVGVPPTQGRPDVTVGEGGAVSWSGPTGLTRALGERIGEGPALAATVAGDPARRGARFGFPNPIGWLRGDSVDGIHHCPYRGSVAGVMAVRPDGHSLAVVDDRRFLDGAALAGGILLAVGGHRGPVWESADRYLDLVVELGLVIADRDG